MPLLHFAVAQHSPFPWPATLASSRPSMRTLGGEVACGRWGRSLSDGGLSESFAVGRVAVLSCCTAGSQTGEDHCHAKTAVCSATMHRAFRLIQAVLGVALPRCRQASSIIAAAMGTAPASMGAWIPATVANTPAAGVNCQATLSVNFRP
jgi:hypothetical protein